MTKTSHTAACFATSVGRVTSMHTFTHRWFRNRSSQSQLNLRQVFIVTGGAERHLTLDMVSVLLIAYISSLECLKPHAGIFRYVFLFLQQNINGGGGGRGQHPLFPHECILKNSLGCPGSSPAPQVIKNISLASTGTWAQRFERWAVPTNQYHQARRRPGWQETVLRKWS